MNIQSDIQKKNVGPLPALRKEDEDTIFILDVQEIEHAMQTEFDNPLGGQTSLIDVLSHYLERFRDDNDDQNFGYKCFKHIANILATYDKTLFKFTNSFKSELISHWLARADCEIQEYDDEEEKLFFKVEIIHPDPSREGNEGDDMDEQVSKETGWSKVGAGGRTAHAQTNSSDNRSLKRARVESDKEGDEDLYQIPPPVDGSYSWEKPKGAKKSDSASPTGEALPLFGLDSLIEALTEPLNEEEKIFIVPQYFQDRLNSLSSILHEVVAKSDYKFKFEEVRGFKLSHPAIFGNNVNDRNEALRRLKTSQDLKKNLYAYKLIATLFKGLQTIYTDRSRDYNLAKKYIARFVGLHYQTICLGRTEASVAKFLVGTKNVRDNLILALDSANPGNSKTGTVIIEIFESAMVAIIRTYAKGGKNERFRPKLANVVKWFVKSVAGIAIATLPKYTKTVPTSEGRKKLLKAQSQKKKIELAKRFLKDIKVVKKPKILRRSFFSTEEVTFVAELNTKLQKIETGVADGVELSADVISMSLLLKIRINTAFAKVKAINSFLDDRKQNVYNVMKNMRFSALGSPHLSTEERLRLQDQTFQKADWTAAFDAYKKSTSYTSLLEICKGAGRLAITDSDGKLTIW
jgi:hypothetical protein